MYSQTKFWILFSNLQPMVIYLNKDIKILKNLSVLCFL